MCQSCVNEGYLSQEVFDKVQVFLDQYPTARFGPGHIVLADCNVERHHIEWCLEQTEFKQACRDETLQATKRFLQELKGLLYD
ncbi:hypothetical protein LCGC14_1375780 [marine sediment metagenome]|uniref:Uncharacterized protein n=1 Tax=marine sediment metagenome TaxID=412755 RepID=A0A0F9K456_9ZZZZ